MMNDSYHTAITVMPNGQVFAGEYDSLRYPSGGFLGSYKYDRKTSLVAKTKTTAKLTALAAAIEKLPYGADLTMLKGASTIADKTNISHLQLIRLYPELQGTPDDYFWLDECFVDRDVPQLEGREPFYDTTATAEYRDRLEETKSTKTKYDEIKYDLKKLTDKVYTPIEDIMRTIINPQTVDMSQLRYGFKWKRNQSALKALKDIGNNQSSIGKFEKLSTAGFHSENRSAKELNELFNAFLKANDVKITHVAMNTKLFTEYSENTWTKSGPLDLNPIRLAGGGVVPLPGIQGVTAVVDVTIPDNTIYAFNKPNALRKAEGAKIMRRYYDEEKDAEAIKVLDFHQYLAVNKQLTKISRKFGMTIPVATS
jgi:hypothetical protein